MCGHRARKEHCGPNGAAASILITHVGRKKQDRLPRIVRTTTASIPNNLSNNSKNNARLLPAPHRVVGGRLGSVEWGMWGCGECGECRGLGSRSKLHSQTCWAAPCQQLVSDAVLKRPLPSVTCCLLAVVNSSDSCCTGMIPSRALSKRASQLEILWSFTQVGFTKGSAACQEGVIEPRAKYSHSTRGLS